MCRIYRICCTFAQQKIWTDKKHSRHAIFGYLRSRCTSAAHLHQHFCDSFWILSFHFTSADVHHHVWWCQTFINVSCLITNCSFSAAVSWRESSQKLLLKLKTTVWQTGRCSLSTTSLTDFEVLLVLLSNESAWSSCLSPKSFPNPPGTVTSNLQATVDVLGAGWLMMGWRTECTGRRKWRPSLPKP
jgi:hypothetical protein